MIDPDAGDGPDPDWYRAELDACRRRITELDKLNTNLEATYRAQHPIVAAAINWRIKPTTKTRTDLELIVDVYLGRR